MWILESRISAQLLLQYYYRLFTYLDTQKHGKSFHTDEIFGSELNPGRSILLFSFERLGPSRAAAVSVSMYHFELNPRCADDRRHFQGVNVGTPTLLFLIFVGYMVECARSCMLNQLGMFRWFANGKINGYTVVVLFSLQFLFQTFLFPPDVRSNARRTSHKISVNFIPFIPK
jgi:hypothetical protein